jgi:transposase
MPKQAYLEKHHSSQELKNRYLKSKDPVESRRWHLIWKVSLGWSIKNSAIAIGLNYEYSKEIIKRYNLLGEQGLKNLKRKERTKAGGKQQILNEQQIQKLKQEIAKRPSDGGIWTGVKVARWIELETGREKVWNQRGWDYLKKCGYSWQRPRPKHRKGDEREQAEFIEKFPEKVQKLAEKYPESEIDVWFFDEHRVGLKPILRKVWAEIGKRPIAVGNHGYQWLYVYGFVKPKTGETLWYLIPRVNTKWLNVVFENFAKDRQQEGINSRALIVEDNAGWHRSKKVELPDLIHIEYLPPYSPELQPAERLWSLVDEPLVNEYFETIDDIEAVLVNRCNVLCEMTKEIKKLTCYHWLSFL